MSESLTTDEAYRAMYVFLEDIWGATKSQDIASLLGDLSLLPDGSPADNAVSKRWATAVEKARSHPDITLKFV